MNNISLDVLNVLNEETPINLKDLKDSVLASAPAIETVVGGRLATKKT